MTDPQDVAVPSLPEPCPFCGVSLIPNTNQADHYVKRYGTHFDHPPQGSCIMAGFEVSPIMVEDWNRRAAGRASAKPEGFVYCWLVELRPTFDGHPAFDATYYTGARSTSMGGHTEAMTRDPMKAARYASKEAASEVASTLSHTLSCVWKAIEHGFAAAPTPTASIAPEAEGEAGGWTKWSGGEMPVADWQIVEYRLRRGGLSFFNSAGGLWWNHDGNGDDIVAYRLPPQGITKCAAPVAQAAAVPGTVQWCAKCGEGVVPGMCRRKDVPELSTASIAEQFTHGMAQAAAAEADELARSIIRTLDLYIGHKPTFDSLCDDINRLARIFLARPEADADRASGGGV